MISIEWLFLMQIVIGVLVIMLLRKIIQMKKDMDAIIKEVKGYVAFIIDEEDDVSKQSEQVTYKQYENVKNLKQNHIGKEMEKNEAQTRLIQAVLREYFP